MAKAKEGLWLHKHWIIIFDIKKQKDQLRLFMASSNKCQWPFQEKNIERA
jgi:hypothetical protein